MRKTNIASIDPIQPGLFVLCCVFINPDEILRRPSVDSLVERASHAILCLGSYNLSCRSESILVTN